jgi:hypothetical protein
LELAVCDAYEPAPAGEPDVAVERPDDPPQPPSSSNATPSIPAAARGRRLVRHNRTGDLSPTALQIVLIGSTSFAPFKLVSDRPHAERPNQDASSVLSRLLLLARLLP